MIDFFLKTPPLELLIRLGIFIAYLGTILAFIWAVFGAVVYLIRNSRVERFMGAEFDPERPTTTNRRRR